MNLQMQHVSSIMLKSKDAPPGHSCRNFIFLGNSLSLRIAQEKVAAFPCFAVFMPNQKNTIPRSNDGLIPPRLIKEASGGACQATRSCFILHREQITDRKESIVLDGGPGSQVKVKTLESICRKQQLTHCDQLGHYLLSSSSCTKLLLLQQTTHHFFT